MLTQLSFLRAPRFASLVASLDFKLLIHSVPIVFRGRVARFRLRAMLPGLCFMAYASSPTGQAAYARIRPSG
jgi:hypothetical protein